MPCGAGVPPAGSPVGRTLLSDTCGGASPGTPGDRRRTNDHDCAHPRATPPLRPAEKIQILFPLLTLKTRVPLHTRCAARCHPRSAGDKGRGSVLWASTSSAVVSSLLCALPEP